MESRRMICRRNSKRIQMIERMATSSYALAFESAINALLTVLFSAADTPASTDVIAHHIEDVLRRGKTIERYLMSAEANSATAERSDGRRIGQLKTAVARGEQLIADSAALIDRYVDFNALVSANDIANSATLT